MYISITIDLTAYDEESIELRLSHHYTIKNLVDIVWQTKQMNIPSREGYWVKNELKNQISDGNKTLKDFGVTTGDRLKIL